LRGFSRNSKKSATAEPDKSQENSTGGMFDNAKDMQQNNEEIENRGHGRSSVGGADAEAMRTFLEEVAEHTDALGLVTKETGNDEEFGDFQDANKNDSSPNKDQENKSEEEHLTQGYKTSTADMLAQMRLILSQQKPQSEPENTEISQPEPIPAQIVESKPTAVENKLDSEYASNNFWKQGEQYKLDELELDYS